MSEETSGHEFRFMSLFEHAPVSMQLLAADGTTVQVNRAWQSLWEKPGQTALTDYILNGAYNVLTDPQLKEKGITPYLERAFAGESVKIPAALYDPVELEGTGRLRWVTATAHPLKDAQGRVREVMLMHEDITEQVEAERRLRDSEERFRSIVMATSQMIWTTTPEGLVLDDSPSWREFTGQTYEQWKDYGWLDAVHPDDREGAGQAFRSAVTNKTVYETQYRVRRTDGQYRWTAVKGVPVLNPDGTIREWTGANADITEQLDMQRALQAGEAQLRLVLDTTQQKVFTATPSGESDYYNPTWSAYTGLSLEEIRGWGWLRFTHPEDVDANLAAWRHSVATGEPYQVEHRFRRADGEYRWHLSRALPVRDEAGAIVKWVGSNTDIHEIKMAESHLEERLAQETRNAMLLQKVAQASHMLHSALSVDNIAQVLVEEVREILQVHQAVVSLTEGDSWAQAINAVSLSDKYADSRTYAAKTDGSGIYALVCRTNKAMRFTQEELERHPAWKGFGEHADRHPPMRGWLAVPLIGYDGRNLGVIQASDKYEGDFNEQDEAILTQLAAIAATGFENARLYGTLKEQDRRKDEFLAMLAHELRNPLAPISAAAELLKLTSLDEDRVRQTSDIISRQVDHMTGLVNDLLDVSRVTRGLVSLERQPENFSHIVADALEQVGPLIRSRGHRMTLQLSSESVTVPGDAKRLVQVVANILGNAAKYTPEGGNILLRTEAAKDKVVLSVTDDGVGMTPELVGRAFDLFVQGERSSDRSSGGLGLGLALVKSLVELHGGTVTCFSEGSGKGSTFSVTLPRLAEQSLTAGGMDGAGDTGGRPKTGRALKLMVVDDNADAANMLGMFLEASGHQVIVEHDPFRALETARAERPQACILDIGLPGMDGNELARRLRSDPAMANGILIAVSGYGQAQDRQNSREAGFDHHLVKPVDLAELTTLLG